MIEGGIVVADAAHIAVIAARVRPADVRELWAQGRMTPAACMRHGLAEGLATWTALWQGRPVAMFGVVPGEHEGEGAPWMVGTVDLAPLTVQKALLVHSRHVVERMRALCPVLLSNAVDDRNAAAKRWLRWLGFTLLPPEPTGLDGEPFRLFYL